MARKWVHFDKHQRNRKRSKGKTRMGKMFTTRSGKYGCYKYVNNRRVAFVTKKRPSRKRQDYNRWKRYN